MHLLMTLLHHVVSCIGGDQGVLNTFFSDWAVKDIRKHLPFVYNLSAGAVYTYLPAFQQYVFTQTLTKYTNNSFICELFSN